MNLFNKNIEDKWNNYYIIKYLDELNEKLFLNIIDAIKKNQPS